VYAAGAGASVALDVAQFAQVAPVLTGRASSPPPVLIGHVSSPPPY